MENLLKKMATIHDSLEPDLLELMPTYYQNKCDDVIKLKAFLNKNDIASIAAIAHKMLGTAKTYGLHKLDFLAMELEENSKRNPSIKNCTNIVNIMENYINEKIGND